ncbi:MAG: hypothetical protein KGZ87_05445 [Bacteroidetes bacterium]|nr:hypothetical protein [Bacteroidota bacterium]
MENPNIKVQIKHSESKTAWNIIGTKLGGKYKIARVPYIEIANSKSCTEIQKAEALKHAEFISFCFNHSDIILANTSEKTDQNVKLVCECGKKLDLFEKHIGICIECKKPIK